MANQIPRISIAEVRKQTMFHLGQVVQAVASREAPRREVIKRIDTLQKWLKQYLRYLRSQPDGLGDAHKDAKPPLILGSDGGVYKP